jgi:membrane protein
VSATLSRTRAPRRRWPSLREWPQVIVRAGKESLDDDVPMLASAMAFNGFLAIPAILLLVVGLFSLVADPALIADLMDRFGAVLPGEAVDLFQGSLLQLEQKPTSGLLMTIVGFALALWTTTGAVNTLMTAVNRAHDLDDERGFLTRRLVAVLLVVALGIAVLTVTAFLILGPHIERWIGAALGADSAVHWAWWTAQWPILLSVLFGAFAITFGLAMDHPRRRWEIISPGAAISVLLWLVVSAGFAFYASRFGSYNKTWGSLSAAIVTLVWLYLSSIALLFGAEVNSEVEAETTDSSEELSGTVERSAPSPLRRTG